MKLIHIDRTGNIKSASSLNLFLDYGTDSFRNIAATYPSGISEHGHHYMFATGHSSFINSEQAAGLCNNKSLEWLFETVRLSHYPNCLSRFQSVFAVEESDLPRLAIQFQLPTQAGTVCYEIESSKVERRDMSLLTGDIATAMNNAHKYWKGDCSANPLYEYLLSPPVTVIQKFVMGSALA